MPPGIEKAIQFPGCSFGDIRGMDIRFAVLTVVGSGAWCLTSTLLLYTFMEFA